jgi:c-di-GMP-binding flagellar brake protein YcgR
MDEPQGNQRSVERRNCPQIDVSGLNRRRVRYLLRDISENGIGLDYSESVKPGETIGIRFLLEGRTISAQAEVRWCDEIKSRSAVNAYSIGLQFTELADADREHIRRYVESKGKR